VTGDEYLQTQLQTILQPGEQVLQTAYMRRQPGLLMQMLLVGGLLLYLMTKAYFAVLTNRRLMFIRTKMGFWRGGPQQQNLGMEEYDVRNVRQVTTSGIANNRSMTFHMHQGPAQTLRISPWFTKVLGTKQFLEQVPQIINSGQLASGQLPAGQPQPEMMQQQAPQQHQQMQQQPMQPQHMQQQQQMMPPQQQSSFQPGQPVMVVAQDGNHYPATVMQAASGQYLCQMPNGQPYWFPSQVVTPR
jgi:hypothetical protein